MSKTPIIVVITCLLALAHQRGASQHYYGGGRSIPLKVDSTLVTVKFDPDFGTNAGEMLLASIDRVTGVIADEHAIDGFVACSLSTGEGYAGFLDSLTAIDGVYSAEPLVYLYWSAWLRYLRPVPLRGQCPLEGIVPISKTTN